MRLKIKSPFRDINNFAKAYAVGDVVDFAEDRAKVILSRGLAEAVVEAQPKADAAVAEKTESPKKRRTKRVQ